MAIRRYKKISELNPVASASLSTYVAGVDNGQTVKITLDVLASGVRDTINSLDDQRLNALENYTASFSSSIPNGTISGSSQLTASFDERYTLSGSIQNVILPNNIVSSSQQISDLGFITSSQIIDTGSFETTGRGILSGSISYNDLTDIPIGILSESVDLIHLNNFTSSYFTDSASFDSRIIAATNEQNLSHLVTTSSFNSYTASISTASLVERLNSLESTTGSYLTTLPNGLISGSSQIVGFETTGRGILSGSISYDSLTNIPSGIVSGASQINNMGFAKVTGGNTFYSEQIFTNNVIFQNTLSASVIDNLNIISSSYLQFTQSFDTISSSFDSRIIAATNEQNLSGFATTSSLNNLSTSVDSRLDLLESFSSSADSRYVLSGSITQTTWDNIASKPSGIVSGSSQLTSSYDLRYTLSGSVQPLPSNLVSSSAQITTFGFVSGSYETTGRGIISSSANLVTTSSYNADSASFDTRINSITVSSGSNLTYLLEAYANVTYTLPGTFTEDPCRYSIVSVNENVPSSWFDTSTYTFTPQKAGYWEIAASYDVYRNTEASMAIKKNGSIVAAAGSFNAVAQQIKKIIYLNGSTDYINIINVGGAALQRAQFQSRSWFQAKFVGNISDSTDLPAGVISGSSQISAFGFVSGSYETTGRGILSGSISYTSLTNIPSGIVSGAAQVTPLLPTGVISGSSQVLGGSGVWSGSAQLPSGVISGSSQITGFETTGRNIISSSTQISDLGYVTSGGDATFNSVTANQYIVSSSVYYVTQSYSSGSTIFGNTADDTHQFTGSVLISGSLTANLTNGHMWVGNSLNKSYEIPTASLLSTASFNSFTSSQFNTLSASVANNQNTINALTASLGATSNAFSFIGVTNPTNLTLVSYATSSFNGGVIDILAVNNSNSTATSTNYQFASFGVNAGISQNGKQTSGAGAPNLAPTIAISGSNVVIQVTLTGTFNIKGVARLF